MAREIDEPARLDVFLARLPLGYSNDIRPCVVLSIDPHKDVAVVAISSSDLYRHGFDFLIPSDAPDFAATGLKKSSFVIGDAFRTIPLQSLSRRKGRLVGKLALDFEKWLG